MADVRSAERASRRSQDPCENPQRLLALPRPGRRPEAGALLLPCRAETPTPMMTAEALLSRQLLGWPRDYPALVKGVGQISADLQSSGERNIYYWYYATQLLHNMQERSVEALEPQDPRGLDRLSGQGRGCARELGPVPTPAGPVGGVIRGPALPDVALDPDPRGLLSLSAALSHGRRRLKTKRTTPRMTSPATRTRWATPRTRKTIVEARRCAE